MAATDNPYPKPGIHISGRRVMVTPQIWDLVNGSSNLPAQTFDQETFQEQRDYGTR